MQQTQILLHIRAVFYSLFSLRNPDHMKKNKLYYIEITNFTTLAGFRPNSEIIGKFRKMGKFYGHFVKDQK